MSMQHKALSSSWASQNKLVVGFIMLVITAVVSTAGMGIAGATSGGGHGSKPTKAQCRAAGFKSYGQCVKEWSHNHGGHGYGGHGHGHHHHKHKWAWAAWWSWWKHHHKH